MHFALQRHPEYYNFLILSSNYFTIGYSGVLRKVQMTEVPLNYVVLEIRRVIIVPERL